MTSIPPSKLKRYVKILKKHGNLSFASPPRVLGEGVFAVVLQARYKSPKDGLTRQVALKIAKKHNADGGNGNDTLKQEYAQIKKVGSLQDGHPNIIAPVRRAAILDKNDSLTQYICLELCNGGSMADWMSRKPLPTVRLDAAAQVLDGLGYLHFNGMYHRDLKPENILLSWQRPTEKSGKGFWRYKIAGFGQAAEGRMSRTIAGTRSRNPPEMIAGAEFDLEKQDVFLFGLLVYWMYRNRLPWKRYPFDVNEKESWIFEQKWDMNNTYSGRFKEFFSKTLNYDPEQRESATELTSRVEEIKAERDEASSQPDQRLDHVTSREPAKISLKHRLQNEKWTVVAWYRHINVSLELRMRCRW